jgi:ABC-2 type transport system permease protein
MITTIARKEMTEIIRDGRFRWTAVAVIALLVAALAMGWRGYRDVKAQHEAARRETRDHWLDQGDKNPHSAAHYGIYAFKPKMPLSLVDRGVDDYTGVAVWLEAHKQNEFKYRPAQDSSAVQRMSELTAATVLQVLIPLLIILLSFSAFAGEREQGTLRQLLSLGVARRHLAAGKALGIGLALACLLVPSAILGVLALALASDDGAMTASAGRLVLMVAAYLAYFAVFVCISLAVSARARSARLALIGLMAFWIVNTLIAPRAVADLARATHPTPSAFEFARQIQTDIQNGIDGHNPADKRNEDLQTRVLAQYGVDRVEQLPVSFAGIALQEGEEYGSQVFDRRYSELWNSFDHQNRLHQLAGAVAPLLTVRSLSMSLSGTDWTQHRDFAAAAERYRRMLVKTMNNDMVANAAGKDYNYLADANLWARVPDFSYEAPSVPQIITGQITAIVILGLWFAGAATLVWVAGRRMRVE